MQECLIFETAPSDVGKKGGRWASKIVTIQVVPVQRPKLIQPTEINTLLKQLPDW